MNGDTHVHPPGMPDEQRRVTSLNLALGWAHEQAAGEVSGAAVIEVAKQFDDFIKGGD